MSQAFPPPQLLQDPYPFYRMLRTNNPVFRVPVGDAASPGLWILTRHRDVQVMASLVAQEEIADYQAVITQPQLGKRRLHALGYIHVKDPVATEKALDNLTHGRAVIDDENGSEAID